MKAPNFLYRRPHSLDEALALLDDHAGDAQVLAGGQRTQLGARGVGEAGAVAAPAAICTAVNDALTPFGAVVTQQPITPEHVLSQVGVTSGHDGSPAS